MDTWSWSLSLASLLSQLPEECGQAYSLQEGWGLVSKDIAGDHSLLATTRGERQVSVDKPAVILQRGKETTTSSASMVADVSSAGELWVGFEQYSP